MIRKTLTASIALALVTTASQAWSDARTLKFHSGLAESRPEAEYLKRFADLVEEYSNGQLMVDVYHAGSLGLKEADMLRIMQRGKTKRVIEYETMVEHEGILRAIETRDGVAYQYLMRAHLRRGLALFKEVD